MTPTRRDTCRACGSRDLTFLFSLGNQYVSGFPEPCDVTAMDRVPIEIVRCGGCTLVQQRYTVPSELLYTGHYWYRSGMTDTMRRALADVVDAAMSKVQLSPGDVVLDIGSNDGTLLRQYPKALGLVRVGVEPASNLATRENYEDQNIGCVRRFWQVDEETTEPSAVRAKIITACGMMYDLEWPSCFLKAVALFLRPDGVFVAQLQCLRQTVRLRDVGNYCHEHLEFYTLNSLIALYNWAGLTVIDVQENDVNGGSYRITAKRSDVVTKDEISCSVHDWFNVERDEGLALPHVLKDHGDAMLANMMELRTLVERLVSSGKKVWVYGASTKGNVILQCAGLDHRLIVAAADRSEEKWGRVTAGTGIPIRSEADFRAAQPDYALVLPYTFLTEFMARETSWRERGGRFIVPIPDVRIV